MSKEGAGEGAREGQTGRSPPPRCGRAPAGSSALERRSTARCSRSVAWVLGGAVTPQTLQTQPVGAGAGRDLESLSSSCPSRGVHRHSLARGRTARITHLRGQAATLAHGVASPDVHVLHSTYRASRIPVQVSDESPSPRSTLRAQTGSVTNSRIPRLGHRAEHLGRARRIFLNK